MQSTNSYARQFLDHIPSQAATADNGDTLLLETVLLRRGEAGEVAGKIVVETGHEQPLGVGIVVVLGKNLKRYGKGKRTRRASIF